MPTLNLKLSPAPPDDVQRRLAQTLTAVTTETLGKRAEGYGGRTQRARQLERVPSL